LSEADGILFGWSRESPHCNNHPSLGAVEVERGDR
jgi:hypothetical protein